MPKNGIVSDVQERRKCWVASIAGCKAENLVFLDESDVNINMTRLYGRALSNERAVDHTPLNTPTTTTVLSSIRLNGEMVYTTYSGGTTAERFRDYLENMLLPTLDEHAVVILDNMRSHHARIVKQLLNEKGIHYVYCLRIAPI